MTLFNCVHMIRIFSLFKYLVPEEYHFIWQFSYINDVENW